MAVGITVNFEEFMTKKWNEFHPGEKMPEIGTKEFVAFCDEVAAASQPVSETDSHNTKTTSNTNTYTTSNTNTYEDDTHRYTKVDGKYIRKIINDWIDDNPGKTIGFVFLAGAILTCKVFQHICTRAVYKGNLRTIKYLMKYSK